MKVSGLFVWRKLNDALNAMLAILIYHEISMKQKWFRDCMKKWDYSREKQRGIGKNGIIRYI